MEDNRLLLHAIDYLTRMAEGKDPLSGLYEPEGSCLYQTRVNRCLLYTIEQLRKIADGQLVPADLARPAARGDRPFVLTPEQLASLKPENRPLSLSRFLDYLRSFAGPGCKKLSQKQVTAWLVSQGLLERGEKGTAVTPGGEEAGIYRSETGFQLVILYRPSAQQWIIDRMPALLNWIAQSAGGTVDPETGELIARGGKRPFSLTEEELDELPILPGGVSISRFVQEVNRHIDPGSMDKLKRETLTGWLTAEGYLEQKEVNGRKTLSPTPKGEQNGIRLEQRSLNGRAYWGVVYYDEGQLLLLNHLRTLCGISD